TDCTHVPGVRMKEIDGPVLCRFTVVAKGSSNLDLQRPEPRYKDIRCSAVDNAARVTWLRFEPVDHRAKELRLAVRPRPGLEGLEGHSRRIDVHDGIGDVCHHVRKFHGSIVLAKVAAGLPSGIKR